MGRKRRITSITFGQRTISIKKKKGINWKNNITYSVELLWLNCFALFFLFLVLPIRRPKLHLPEISLPFVCRSMIKMHIFDTVVCIYTLLVQFLYCRYSKDRLMVRKIIILTRSSRVWNSFFHIFNQHYCLFFSRLIKMTFGECHFS